MTEKTSANLSPVRIMAIRDGEKKPLFESASQGACSPSPTLLIERHDLCPTDWQTIMIPEQVLTLYLRRCAVDYDDGSSDNVRIIRTKDTVSIEKRACEQRIRWSSHCPTLTVRLSDTALEQATESVPFDGDGVAPDRAGEDTRLSALLLALDRERIDGYPSGRLFVDGIEHALAATLVRYDGVTPRERRPVNGGLASYRMKRVINFIHDHIESEISLNMLAQIVGLSPSHFCSLFRMTSGTTPHQFVLRCRVEHAKALLGKPNRSILDIALSSGFQTHQHFSRIFRRYVGLSPSVYRARL
jgi:AraC family transcriptional regulator